MSGFPVVLLNRYHWYVYTLRHIARGALVSVTLLVALALAVIACDESAVDVSAPDAPPSGGASSSSNVVDPQFEPDYLVRRRQRDEDLPLYDPAFGTGPTVALEPDALVIGVEIGGEVKAYTVSILKRHKIVSDEVGKLPVLVSW